MRLRRIGRRKGRRTGRRKGRRKGIMIGIRQLNGKEHERKGNETRGKRKAKRE